MVIYPHKLIQAILQGNHSGIVQQDQHMCRHFCKAQLHTRRYLIKQKNLICFEMTYKCIIA